MVSDERAATGCLLHITTGRAWDQASVAGVYLDPSLESEGFIHCSFRNQVVVPANERFAGRVDLILLAIDRERLTSPVVVEDSYGSGTEFPHVYGPINLDAVVSTIAFPPDEAGRFQLPAELA